jgi:hypothetical protein
MKYSKDCPNCKATFATNSNFDIYCSLTCKDENKAKLYLAKWAAGKSTTRLVKPHQRLRHKWSGDNVGFNPKKSYE